MKQSSISLSLQRISSKLFGIVRKCRLVLSSLLISDSYKSTPECDVLFICHDSNRGETLEGKAHSRHLDSIADELVATGLRCAHIALPYSRLVGKKANGSPMSFNRAYAITRILDLLSRLPRALGLSSPNQVGISSREKIFRIILEKSKARCVICIGCAPELATIANARRIPIIEVLHGYGYSRVSWGYERRKPQELPSLILAFDRTSFNTFSKLGEKSVTVRHVMDPWLSRFSDATCETKLPTIWRYRKKPELEGRKTILFSMQRGYAGEYKELSSILENGLIPASVLDAVEASAGDVNWIFRLHPAQLRRHGSYHVNVRDWVATLCQKHKNCYWEEYSEMPLPVILRYVDGHVTMSSMTAYDCAYFGIRTLYLCPTLKKGGFLDGWYSDLILNGYAKLGNSTVQEILDWVQCAERISPMRDSECTDDCVSVIESVLNHRANC